MVSRLCTISNSTLFNVLKSPSYLPALSFSYGLYLSIGTICSWTFLKIGIIYAFTLSSILFLSSGFNGDLYIYLFTGLGDGLTSSISGTLMSTLESCRYWALLIKLTAECELYYPLALIGKIFSYYGYTNLLLDPGILCFSLNSVSFGVDLFLSSLSVYIF